MSPLHFGVSVVSAITVAIGIIFIYYFDKK